MNFVIPMAGRGSRFKNNNYELPKYLIEVKNKKLIEYSINSLPLEIATNIIFIALEEHVIRYNLNVVIQEILEDKQFQIVSIPEVTQGQAQTALCAKDYIDYSKDLVIYNIDTYFKSDSLKRILMSEEQKRDGVLGAFKSKGSNWSFAQLNEQNIVIKTAEKEAISNNALTGFYHFTNPLDFIMIAENNILKNIKSKNEFYIAPMYNQLIEKGKKFVLDFTDKFIPLGTPEEVEEFKNI